MRIFNAKSHNFDLNSNNRLFQRKTDWTKDYMTENDILIAWPRRFKPLPEGYTVWWVDCVEHYMGMGPNETESSIYSSRFDARRWCFAHHTKHAKPSRP